MSMRKNFERYSKESDELFRKHSGLLGEINFLDSQISKLKGKTSPEAENLLADKVNARDKLCSEIEPISEELASVMRKRDTLAPYSDDNIRAQTTQIATEFFNYVKQHFNELVEKVSCNFKIKDCCKNHMRVHKGKPAPVSIWTDTYMIAYVKNDFFAHVNQKHMSLSMAPYKDGLPDPNYIWWYGRYASAFCLAIPRALEEQNPYTDTFKVVFPHIDSYERLLGNVPQILTFTLELV